ncbi:hypothetical protein G647_08014 [Cladophialophora carrionii CBS 160.54]|uniref:Uncharacterized protein n=1 Tax=Cladophialophora carrionii CBS 160.54 TaxID=1279043 RepID=V9D6Q6_9EURO|nr:uncharacterized protein G647_08014 [Cladophialophora carrionii CBS 160.54]ETI21667.1 hypothetical protein G647_08014 [Cladophialophora carrionii CBS 160.54]
MFCFREESHKHHVGRKSRGHGGKDPDRVARFSPHFHRGRHGHSTGKNDAPPQDADETPPGGRTSIASRKSRLDTRSVHDELKDVEDRLFEWLTDHNLPVDQSQNAATFLLNKVFASHGFLQETNQRQVEKLRQRDIRLQRYETAVTTRDEKILSLEQHIYAERAAAQHEKSQLYQEYQNQLQWERANTERLMASHAEEVADMNRRQSECEKQHKAFVDSLVSDHQSRIHLLIQEHETDNKRRDDEYSANIAREEEKVKEAEREMCLSVDNFRGMQDAELEKRFYKLTTEIEGLSRLTSAPDFAQQAEAMGLNIRPACTIPPQDHKFLFQSILWKIVIDGTFLTPFRVFGAYGDPIYQTWKALFGVRDQALPEWPEPDPLAEKWRYTTVDRLRIAQNALTGSHSQRQEIQTSYQDRISALTSALSGLFAFPSTANNNSPSLATRLDELLDQASEFAILIAVQRYRVRFFLPSSLGPRSQLDPKYVKGVYPASELEFAYANAEFVVSPGLVKEGNSRGGKLEEKVPLIKAVVYFNPGT